jgi:hypothetical protein
MHWLSAYHVSVDYFRKIVTEHPVSPRLNLLECVEYYRQMMNRDLFFILMIYKKRFTNLFIGRSGNGTIWLYKEIYTEDL